MQRKTDMDCVIVGYNDVGFGEFAEYRELRKQHQGMYTEILHNSVMLNGRRTHYMELLNHVLTRATGHNPRLNVFEMPNLAVCYLKSFLSKRHLNVEIVNFYTYESEKFKDILAQSPRAVAITTTYYVDPTPIIDIVQFVREHGGPETKIIVGGPHIFNSAFNNVLKEDPITQDYIFGRMGADIYITDSQGEMTLSRVLQQLRSQHPDLSRIPNLIYTTDGTTFQRTAREIEDNGLDENTVDWNYFSHDFVAPVNYMRTARSCPFSCAFCNFPAFAGDHKLASIDAIEKELQLLKAMGVEYMIFVDDTFNVPLPRFKKLCRMMINNKFDFKWVSFFRCSNADDETFALMAESGCIAVYLGVESGDQTILNNMNKFAQIDRYIYGINQLNAHGIVTHCAIIVGFPGETRDTVMNTMAFMDKARPTCFNAHLYYHDPLSPIHKRSEEFGIVGGDFSWRHNTMDWREAARWAEYMTAHVHNSIPLTNYGFDIWAFPYLLSRGLSLQQILDFTRVAQEMLVQSFDDVPIDFSAQEKRLIKLFTKDAPPVGPS
jgi:radical SAM PhpK family P-methyltransferase